MRRARSIDLADAYGVLSRLLPGLPPRFAYAACERMGWIAPHTPAWSNIMTNLARVLPTASEAQRAHYARQVFSGLMKNYYDLLRSHALSSDDLVQMTDARGLHHLRAALQRGRGVLVALPHMGNISLLGEPMALALDQHITVVVEQMADPRVHTVINALRKRQHVTLLELGPGVARTLLRTLRNGQIVVLPSDRTVSDATVEVPFFGAQAVVPAGPAALALRAGAPLLTAYTYRQADQRSMVEVDPPLLFERSGDYARDTRRIMAAVMRIFESYIRRRPGQWLLTERVWAES